MTVSQRQFLKRSCHSLLIQIPDRSISLPQLEFISGNGDFAAGSDKLVRNLAHSISVSNVVDDMLRDIPFDGNKTSEIDPVSTSLQLSKKRAGPGFVKSSAVTNTLDTLDTIVKSR